MSSTNQRRQQQPTVAVAEGPNTNQLCAQRHANEFRILVVAVATTVFAAEVAVAAAVVVRVAAVVARAFAVCVTR
jgi:hypothetical protein